MYLIGVAGILSKLARYMGSGSSRGIKYDRDTMLTPYYLATSATVLLLMVLEIGHNSVYGDIVAIVDRGRWCSVHAG